MAISFFTRPKILYRLEEPQLISEIISETKPHGFDDAALALKNVDDVRAQNIVLMPKRASIRKCHAKFTLGGTAHYLLWANGKTVIDTLVPEQEQQITIFIASKGMKLPDGIRRDEFFLNTEDRIAYPFMPTVPPRKVEFSVIAENYRRRRPWRFTLNVNSFETIRLTPCTRTP
jgi:hypothetical protein